MSYDIVATVGGRVMKVTAVPQVDLLKIVSDYIVEGATVLTFAPHVDARRGGQE